MDSVIATRMLNSRHPYLYRIMPLRHVVDLFESRELYFASPESWDDPYEKVLRHKGSTSAFAQCWCTRAVSDAMWLRIPAQRDRPIRPNVTGVSGERDRLIRLNVTDFD